MWDGFSNLFCWVMKTFSLQKEVIDKLKQLLLLSAEVYEFSINPPPDEPYCFYKVPSYLIVLVHLFTILFHSPLFWTGAFHSCTGPGAVQTSHSEEGSVRVWLDWLIDWLVGWLIDWLTDFLITDWLVDWLVGWLIDWLVGWLIDW